MARLTDPADLVARVTAARVARLSTIRPDGTPRLVPITFAVVDGLLGSAVETVKPKASTRLARLADVRRDARVGVLVDHYDEDWARLWWVRIDGTAAIVQDHPALVTALRAKYESYRSESISGPFLVLTPLRWTGWSAAAP
ncbi:MAG: TIGR03668 family PPOX class F420-dependent oxidoreductase [Geodermatophilaceae bacterium]|nr:TIGR03668 family PPOX class F420-dependent oxidoreductase [Geodermatophilaceae bacterium]